MVNILYFDIESAPNLGYTWGKYEQNVLSYEREGYMLCFAYAWNDGKVKVVSLPDFGSFKKDQTNDYELVKALWELLNKADIVIAHNAKQFDIKYTNGRFLKHDLPSPDNYQVVDTLLVARNKFKLNSNKLDDLGKLLNLGGKKDTGGFELWLGCMANNEHSWSKMKKYNKHDVVLLRDVYKKLRGWMSKHPNMNVIDQTADVAKCSVCQSEHLVKKGFEPLGNQSRQRWKCRACGANLYTGHKGVLPLKSA